MQLVICRSFEVFTGVHWKRYVGWCENSTRWKSCKQRQARGRGAWTCLAHGLQCLCDGRACCPARAMQLVIFIHLHPNMFTCTFFRYFANFDIFTPRVLVLCTVIQDTVQSHIHSRLYTVNRCMFHVCFRFHIILCRTVSHCFLSFCQRKAGELLF